MSMPRLLFRLRTFSNGEWHCAESHSMLLWAGAIGIAGALATVAFRDAVDLLRWMMVGEAGSLVDKAARLPWYHRLLVPAVGGLLAGCLLVVAARSRKEAGGQDYMEAIYSGNGRLSLRQTLLRSASSICTIASGGSIGREGSMIQLAALCASQTGIAFRLSVPRLRLLVACGAAAGITSAYNAPIAGAFFISEVVLRSIAMDRFGPILVASVAANITMRLLPGYRPPYEMPAFPAIAGIEILLFIVLGILIGLAAPLFLHLLEISRRGFERTQWPLPVRLGLGGLLLGLLSIPAPEIWGNGYEVVNAILHEPWAWTALLAILVLKIAATAATAGSGAVGGVFTPALFVGAVIGCLFGHAAQALWPHVASAPFAYAVVGMGAFLAAAASAPLMSMLMIFEMTLSYQVMLPLILCCVLAYFVSSAVGSKALYEITGRHRQRDRELRHLQTATVEQFIRPAETVLPVSATVREAARVFVEHPVKYAYIVDHERRYCGTVALSDIASGLLSGQAAEQRRAADLPSQRLQSLTPDMSLAAALEHFMTHRGERLPVVQSRESPVLLGVVYKTTLLKAYSRMSGLALK
jgi:CIC family chloride channel protein